MNVGTLGSANIMDRQLPLSLASSGGERDLKAGSSNRNSNNNGSVKCARNRFANLKASQMQFRSVKFSANNFVTQSYTSFTEHYEIVELLGEGGYGEVFVCAHKESNAERAVKILKVRTEEDADKVLSEFEILKGIDHPNMLKVYQLYEDKGADTFYIVSDLYEGGELFDEIEELGYFVEEEAALIMNQVLSCVNYCHSKGIVHRDLKPENILLADSESSYEDVKVIDFGLATTFDKDCKNVRFTEKVGSSYYIAPEVMNGDYGTKCDVWSCGVVAFILLAGEAPFDGDDDDEIMESVLSGEFTVEDELWAECSDECKDFVKYLLTYDENERPTAEEALQHPWLRNARRNSSSMLLERKDKGQMAKCFHNLEKFDPYTKLHQVTYAFIASQLIAKHEKDVVDEIFRALDGNCDGSLAKEELKEGFKEFQGRDLTDQEVDAIFERVNYSCSGAIEYSEFLVASIELDEDRLRAAFSEFSQGGHFLFASDLRELLATKEGSDSVVQKIMDQTDVDQDGCLSFEDFYTSMTKPAPSVGQFSFTSCFARSSRTLNKTKGRGSLRRGSLRRGSLRRASHILIDDDEEIDFEMLLAKVDEGLDPESIDKRTSEGKLHFARRAQLSNLKTLRKIKTLNRTKTGDLHVHRPHAFSIGYAKQSKRLLNVP